MLPSARLLSLSLHCHYTLRSLESFLICNLSLDFIIFFQSQAPFE